MTIEKKEKRHWQPRKALTALVLAVVIALGINIGSAKAETADEAKPELLIPPQHWSVMLTNGQHAITPPQVGRKTIVLFKNYTHSRAPTIPVWFLSPGPCNLPEVILVEGPDLHRESCEPGGQVLIFVNGNLDAPASYLWIDLINY